MIKKTANMIPAVFFCIYKSNRFFLCLDMNLIFFLCLVSEERIILHSLVYLLANAGDDLLILW